MSDKKPKLDTDWTEFIEDNSDSSQSSEYDFDQYDKSLWPKKIIDKQIHNMQHHIQQYNNQIDCKIYLLTWYLINILFLIFSCMILVEYNAS